MLYNVMFVLPLVALLIAVHYGINALRLASLTSLDAFAGKILTGGLLRIARNPHGFFLTVPSICFEIQKSDSILF